MAASVHNAAISAPTKPWVSLAISSGSTSSESYKKRKNKKKQEKTKEKKRSNKKLEKKKNTHQKQQTKSTPLSFTFLRLFFFQQTTYFHVTCMNAKHF